MIKIDVLRANKDKVYTVFSLDKTVSGKFITIADSYIAVSDDKVYKISLDKIIRIDSVDRSLKMINQKLLDTFSDTLKSVYTY